MAATAIGAAAEALKEHFGNFERLDALGIEAAMGELEEVYTALGGGVRQLASRIEQGPIHSSVPEHLNDLANNTDQLADVAKAGVKTLNDAHPDEMNRLHDPRALEAETFDLDHQEG